MTGLENATGDVTVRADNKIYSAPIVDGIAEVVIPGLTKSTIAYVDYGGDRIHNPSNTTVQVTVNKLNTTLIVNSVTVTYNVNKNLVITLEDVNGTPLSGLDISVDLNGVKTYTTDKNGQVNVATKGFAPKTYTAKTNSKGQATFKLSITKKGTFSATVKFDGDKIYAASSKSAKITIK